jgi:vitamin B12 transporter
MQTNFRNTISVLAILAAPGATPALAQDLDIGEVVVTANKTPTEKSKVGSTVTVVTKKDIDKESKPAVVDYLNQVPGVYFSTPGGMGQEGTLIMRGADKKYIKTLFNGIDISDPTSTQVQTSYQHLLTGGVDRIEVLQGSQSMLYGADAVAGVIDISTLGGLDLGVHNSVSMEAGSHGTVLGGYGLSAASETGKMATNFYGLYTDGISAADENNGNSEPDAYRNYTATFAGQQQISDNVTIFGSGLWIKGYNQLDNGFPVVDELNSFGRSEQIAGRVGANIDSLDGRFQNTFSIQNSRINRLSHTETTTALSGYDDVSDAYFHGNRFKAEYQGTFRATDTLTFVGGADYQRESARNSTQSTKYGPSSLSGSVWDSGVWGEAIWSPLQNLTLTGGLRYDDHQYFGGHTTWRATVAYLIPETGTKLRGSMATGFRAPSIYELYSPPPFTGNLDLKPETSFGWDVGVDQALLDGKLNASVTYFVLDTKNLIDFVVTDFTTYAGHYAQVPGTTKRHGVEIALSYDVNAALSLGAGYTYTSAVDATGARRPRVPRHQIGLNAAYKPAEKWTISATGLAALDTIDGFPPTALKDYVLLDAKISYKPTEATEIYLRGENLLNQKYEVVKGYGTPGLGVFAGFKATF